MIDNKPHPGSEHSLVGDTYYESIRAISRFLRNQNVAVEELVSLYFNFRHQFQTRANGCQTIRPCKHHDCVAGILTFDHSVGSRPRPK